MKTIADLVVDARRWMPYVDSMGATVSGRPEFEALLDALERGEHERALLTEVADFLAEQGYPRTANMLRDGSWRR